MADSDPEGARAEQNLRGTGSSAGAPSDGAGNARGTNTVGGDAPGGAPLSSSAATERRRRTSPGAGLPEAAATAAVDAPEGAALPASGAAGDGASSPSPEPTAGEPAVSKGLAADLVDAVPELAAERLDGTLQAEGSGAALLPIAGNPSGNCVVPPEGAAVDTEASDRVVGDGTPESCSADAFIEAVALGGKITFDCGPEPVEITLDRPAKVVNDAAPEVVIDGGGLVTLSGGGTTRILYMNTCDPEQHFTTAHCDDQDTPRLTVQNLTFSHGNSAGEREYAGGGAIWARGGQLKVVNSRFFGNTCVDTGPDVGGAAIRAFSQFENRPIYVVGSTFGGAPGLGNACSNGGGISSINVSWSIYNSVFSHNRALGNGGNPAEEGTPGGGSGGGIYSDGMSNVLRVCGTRIEDNAVNAYGSGIFFVNNDHGGSLELDSTLIRNNTGGGWNVLPGVSMHEDTVFELHDTLLE